MNLKEANLQQTKHQQIIESAFENRTQLTPQNVDPALKKAVLEVIEDLDQGKIRVAEKQNGVWTVNDWIKKAILLSFKTEDNAIMDGSYTQYFDKIPAKFANYDLSNFKSSGARVVPPATVRRGAYIAEGVILMPSFVNIGARVESGAMIDSWTTIGSCAQIGKNVHVSANVMIGGVLEPLQASPTIIEDNCFIGACSGIAEGTIIEQGAVISMGVTLSQSTKIFDRQTGEIFYGRVPAGSVVVSGTMPGKDGSYGLYCAVIVKRVDEKTRGKVSINELLRDIT
jgi:2,3,4,5-tetrahydropyridine-2-carboxylate N-succinyltransferase